MNGRICSSDSMHPPILAMNTEKEFRVSGPVSVLQTSECFELSPPVEGPANAPVQTAVKPPSFSQARQIGPVRVTASEKYFGKRVVRAHRYVVFRPIFVPLGLL